MAIIGRHHCRHVRERNVLAIDRFESIRSRINGTGSACALYARRICVDLNWIYSMFCTDRADIETSVFGHRQFSYAAWTMPALCTFCHNHICIRMTNRWPMTNATNLGFLWKKEKNDWISYWCIGEIIQSKPLHQWKIINEHLLFQNYVYFYVLLKMFTFHWNNKKHLLTLTLTWYLRMWTIVIVAIKIRFWIHL